MRNVIAAFIIMIVAVMTAHTQNALRPRQMVEQAHLEGKSFTQVSLFERAVNFRSEVETTPIERYTLLHLDSEGLRQLASAPPAALLLELPFESSTILLELVVCRGDLIPISLVEPVERFAPLCLSTRYVAHRFEEWNPVVPVGLEHDRRTLLRGYYFASRS